MQLTSASPPALGIAHFTTIDAAPLDFVALAAKIGYATVGLRLHPAFPGAPFYEIRPGSALMASMRALLANTGLRVHDIEFVVIDGSFSPAGLAQVLESAAELGAKRLSVCGDDPEHGRLVANFAALCDLAAGFGLGVDLENMPWRHVASIQDAVRVVLEAERANGGVLVDALHLARGGGSPADLRDMPRQLIRSAQLCDAAAGRPASVEAIIQEARGGRLLPGQGVLPLQTLLAELPADAVLSVEVPNHGAPAQEHAQAVFDAAMTVMAVRDLPGSA
ncbi:sugar phosphate isomerase/epimerase family protein [Bosea psychrotolerans]|uniref:Sugar phosphate isomerase/epimerase n=1 Tax=Bosea psychrotolerans TaxID=1871628 RepID=A0A2S4M6X2_9HYPH|nr:TIM barrel protein [Bosea psychrotolerans]POR50375.1 sugar phosphate isomerase/epimerase [Bosea psychrotolerans]